ncbi:hypothetical protein BS47DRAFT_1336670 [Hydnum rufescens UP504]|uniref:Chromatin assembly factor 1 subunit A dimerization domain-containing protein n=1 Tax=Hydnum rufescens UP504 TaxID=1448309 RepID=A0A9P6DYX1_9AGAM|nr:hypothetical protein BS47DRAFT_1336670 [Hydnum rufescens UP504]
MTQTHLTSTIKAPMEAGRPSPSAPSAQPMIELKAGKVIFRQKSIDWAGGLSGMKALVAFNEYLESHSTPPTSIPHEYMPLIAKFVHESDKSLNALVKHLKKSLILPAATTDADNKITNSVLENAIQCIAERQNYGIRTAPSALLSVWRWEVKDLSLVSESTNQSGSTIINVEMAIKRQAQRAQAKIDINNVFDALPQEERDSLSKGGAGRKDKDPTGASRETRKSEASAYSVNDENKGSKPKLASDVAEPIVNGVKSAKKAIPKDKDKGTLKSAAVLTSFFSKAQTSKRVVPRSQDSSSKSDYERHFLPFTVKKHTVLAPINRFHQQHQIPHVSGQPEIISIDDDEPQQMDDIHVEKLEVSQTAKSDRDVEMAALSGSSLTQWSANHEDYLAEFLSKVPIPRRIGPSHSLPSARATRFRSHAPISVRQVMGCLIEAEVNGDEKTTRDLHTLLGDHQKIPRKLLQFCENSRPPYYGTWTKSSTFVGPRTPFARDLVAFDYSYDSGDDWEEEEVEGAEELVSELDSDGSGGDDFEADDWLVGDDEDIEVAGDPAEGDPTDPRILKKRKAENAPGAAVATKKRRPLAGPLVPFFRGPCFEDVVGQCQYEPFNAFRIQLLNDTPFGIDPFSFVSTCLEDYRASYNVHPSQNPIHPMETKPMSTSRPFTDFAVPAVPPHILLTHPQAELSESNTPLTSSTSSATLVPTATNTPGVRSAPKKAPIFTLPTALFPSFLSSIDGSTLSKPVLIDELFKKFKTMPDVVGLRKGAVESKLAEVAFKEKRVWKVKAEVWAETGVPPP